MRKHLILSLLFLSFTSCSGGSRILHLNCNEVIPDQIACLEEGCDWNGSNCVEPTCPLPDNINSTPITVTDIANNMANLDNPEFKMLKTYSPNQAYFDALPNTPDTACEKFEILTLKPDSSFVFGDFKFSAETGALSEQIKLKIASQCNYKSQILLRHVFTGQGTNNFYAADIHREPSLNYAQLHVSLADPSQAKNIVNSSKLLLIQNAQPNDDLSNHLLFAALNVHEPVFGSQINTSSQKTYSLATMLNVEENSESGWLTTIEHALNTSYEAVSCHVNNFAHLVGAKVGEKLEKFLSTCYACEQIAARIVGQFTCEALLGNLKSFACNATLATLAGPVALIPGANKVICSGVSWALEQVSKKFIGQSSGTICNTTLGLEDYSSELKCHIDSLCVDFMPNLQIADKPCVIEQCSS